MAAIALLPQGAPGSPIERVSEWEMPAGEAWAQPGFRLQLRVGYDGLTPTDTSAPGAAGLSLEVEPGARISRTVSLSATLRYSILGGDFRGLRWSTTGDATWHPGGGGFFLAAGVGYGGLLGDREDFSEGPGRCDGGGVVALARTGWLFPVGELFATGPVAQLDQQWTRCAPSRLESWDGGGERQPFRWQHRTLHLAWSFAWR